jgi:hypothetical protein
MWMMSSGIDAEGVIEAVKRRTDNSVTKEKEHNDKQ